MAVGQKFPPIVHGHALVTPPPLYRMRITTLSSQEDSHVHGDWGFLFGQHLWLGDLT